MVEERDIDRYSMEKERKTVRGCSCFFFNCGISNITSCGFSIEIVNIRELT